ncbi:MAG: ATP-binding protein, partial [bacterium]
MLFGADRVAYISTEGDRYETTHRGDRTPDDTGWAQSWIDRLKPGDAYVSADTGFCVRVMYQNATLGLLIVDSISLPQHKQDYLNLAINVISVCGLAITNARSISRRQRAEKELTFKSEELARSNADLDEFAHVVSHDLQAPLGMIIVMGDLLRDEGAVRLNETGRNGIDSIQKCARRMKNLIDGLLSYARVKKSGKAFVVVPLANPVQQAVTDLAKSIQETGAKVEVDALPTVFGDELQLYQLFLNLIGNAVKFVPAGRAPRVYLSSRSVDKGMMEISVSDNGIGFDEKDVDKMFQPFQRLQTQQAYSGSGIGLAVCQKIVQRHGGTITARSRLGEGSTFLVTLPQH